MKREWFLKKYYFALCFASLTTQVEKIETEISSIQFMLFTTQGTTASSEQISGAHWMAIWIWNVSLFLTSTSWPTVPPPLPISDTTLFGSSMRSVGAPRSVT